MVNIRKLVIYDSAKRIPNIRCACCDRKLIDYDKLKRSWAAAERPLSKALEKDFAWLEEQHPVVYSLLKSVAGENPKKSIDNIMEDRSIYGKMREAIDEDILLSDGNISPSELKRSSSVVAFDILASARTTLRKAPVVMRKFEKFKKYLDGEKLKTFEQFQIYSEKYPHKTLSEIVQMEEVYAFHAKKDIMDRVEKREILDFHFNNIEKMIKKKSPESVERFQALKEETMEMFGRIFDPKIRIAKVKNMYSAALKECGCEKLEKKIFEELDAVPKSFVTSDSFLVHARNHKYSDGAIIESLFNPKVASTEHIVPRSAGGKDELSNYIVMCRSCNLSRRSNSYDEHLTYYPEMKRNTEKQVKIVANRVAKGQMTPEFNFYPLEVSQTLREYTQGKINPDVSEYCAKMIEKSNQKISENVEQLRTIKQEKAVTTVEKHRVQEELRTLSRKLDSLDAEADDVAQSNMEQQEIKKAMQKYLDINA